MRELAATSIRITKRISYITGMLGVAIWFGAAGVNSHFLATRPRVPVISTQHTFPLSDHGNIVYLTPSDTYLYYGMQALGLVLLIVGMSLYAYWYRGDEELNREILRKAMTPNKSLERTREK
jgi:hypothetical protein